MKKKINWLLAILYIIYVLGLFYVQLPPLNWHAPQFWYFLLLTLGPLLVVLIVAAITTHGIALFKRLREKMKNGTVIVDSQDKKWKMIAKCSIAILVLLIVFPTVSGFLSSRLLHAKEYASRIDIENVEFSEIPEVDIKKIPIIDRDSSERLGDKVMGNMTEWVSQFDVSDEYTQISYKESVYRVTPLTYNGIIKYFKNKNEGVPAYITVDSTSGKTNLVKLRDLNLEGMHYVPSAYFNENLMRHLRFQYPTVIFGSPSFEIDENGHPWYICSTYTYKGIGMKKSVTGAIFLDPITGDSYRYALGEIPEWADRIYPESLVIEELDDNGSLQGGYWNSIFGQNGVTVTSEGYNYMEKDGDIWLYSGITSANSDESNLGFVLVNLRTHEAMKIATAGADEYSAMRSAESEVKNYGYESTFPLLTNINGNPVYLMSLKDNGLIKMYATVSAVDYQLVATVNSDEGLNALFKKILAQLGTSDKVAEENLANKEITVKDVEKVNVEGNTVYYIQDDIGDIYRITFAMQYENELIFLKAGDVLHISYVDGEGIKVIQKIE